MIISNYSRSAKFGAKLLVGAALAVSGVGCVQQMTSIDKDARKTGIVQYQQGNYAVAAGSFKSAVRSEPRDYKSFFYMGCCYDAMQMYHESVGAYKSALSVMDLSWDGARDGEFRGRVLDALATSIAKSDDRHAELDLIEKQAKEQQKAEPYYLMAKIFRYGRDADSAIDHYNHAIMLEPNNFAMTKEFGLYLEQLGQARLAETTLRQAYAMNMADEQVASALRRLGVIPGPAVKDQHDLAGPALPQGPLPDFTPQTSHFRQGPSTPAAPAAPAASTDTGPHDQ